METEFKQTSRRAMIHFGAGLVLIVAAMMAGHYTRIAEKLELDFGGRQIMGDIVHIEGREYRIRYVHPTGAIYSKRVEFAWGGGDEDSAIAVAYDPESPRRFQPHGDSYLPLSVCIVLFVTGFTNLLIGRRLTMGRLRDRAATLKKGAR